MQVRILTSIAGHAEAAYNQPDFAYQPSDTPDIDARLAAAWIDAGICEAIKGKPSKAATQPASTPAPEV